MKIETEISTTIDGVHRLRGHGLLELMEQRSFMDVLFLLWRGDFPTFAERSFLETMCIAVIEHGVDAPSIFVPRVVASTGNPLQAALAVGVLTIGETHGGAVEAAAVILASPKTAEEIVAERLQARQVIPGFGHKVYTTEDPRATLIFRKAKELGLPTEAFAKAYAIEAALTHAKGRALPLNVDGAIAAGSITLRCDPAYGKAFFIIPRMVGMAAHVVEEQRRGAGYRRLTDPSATSP